MIKQELDRIFLNLTFKVSIFRFSRDVMRSVWQGLNMPAQFFVRAMHYKNVKGDHIVDDSDIPYDSILAYIDECLSSLGDKKQAEVRSYMQQSYPGETGIIQRDRHFFNFLKYVGKTVERVVSFVNNFDTQQEMEDYCKEKMAIVTPSQSQSQSRSQSKSQLQSQSQRVSQREVTIQTRANSLQSTARSNHSQNSISESQSHTESPLQSPTQQPEPNWDSNDSEVMRFPLPSPRIVTSSRHPNSKSSHIQTETRQSDVRDLPRQEMSSIQDQLRDIRTQQLEHSRLLTHICTILQPMSIAHHQNTVSHSG